MTKIKKYYVTARIVTKNISGYVMAKTKKEAIEKFESNEDVFDDREEHDCETINTECEEVENA